MVRYLVDLPGVFLPHSGVTLFHHLLGTYRILKAWGCDDDLCAAGLFHSIYGTPAYLDGPLPVSGRGELRDLIGGQAEELVYQFSLTSWQQVLESGPDVLVTLPQSLLTLAAANIAEQWARLTESNLGESTIKTSAEGFALLLPYLPPMAARSLSLELKLLGGKV